jgi:sec-independent protein translocase protein TatA
MFGLDAPELIIIAVVILVLFGSKKLPDAARSLGRSMRIFKAETRGMKADEKQAAIEPVQPEVTRPNPSGEIPVAEPLTPEPPVGEPVAGAPVNEPRAGSEPR